MIKFFIFLVLICYPLNILLADNDIIVLKIQSSWNNVQTMSGEFSQLDPDGNLETGKFYFSKPYQSKFIYENKDEDIITNESLIRIVDKEGFKIDSYTIGDNFFKKILANDLDIKKELEFNFFEENEKSYRIGFKSPDSNSLSEVMLTFNKDTIDIEKWEISDEFGNQTVLKFTKIKKNIFISQNLFVVRYRND